MDCNGLRRRVCVAVCCSVLSRLLQCVIKAVAVCYQGCTPWLHHARCLAILSAYFWNVFMDRPCTHIHSLSLSLSLSLIHTRAQTVYVYLYIYMYTYRPTAPMNHVNHLRAGPAEMPFQTWYTANTNHFRLTDFCQAEVKKTAVSNKLSTA